MAIVTIGYDARARDARDLEDSAPGDGRTARRPDHESEGKIRAFKPPVGEAYGRIEAPKGELGFYLISDGSGESVSLPRASAELHQPHVLEDMCLGHTVADVMVILGSIDIVLGEVDR